MDAPLSGGATDAQNALLESLDERAAVYDGLDRAAAERLRGSVLSRFADAGLPAEALPLILEELDSGDSPYGIAAAAQALAGWSPPFPSRIAVALMAAADRLLYADDAIAFAPEATDAARRTTVLTEIFTALGRCASDAAPVLPRLTEIAAMSPRPFSAGVARALDGAVIAIGRAGASCCCSPPEPQDAPAAALAPGATALADLKLQDQHGHIAPFASVFDRPVNLVAFFYTRCMNPTKCSATIETLAGVQAALGPRAETCRIGALSYDPVFDTPARLESYGLDRGIGARSPVRLLRSVDGIEPLIAAFDLAVGYGETTVNRHRVEVFLIDRDGVILASILRRRFTVEDVLSLIEKVAP